MNTIVSEEGYRDLLKKQSIQGTNFMKWLFFGIGLFILVEGFTIGYLISKEAFFEIFVWFLIPSGVMLIIAGLFELYNKNVKSKPFDNYVFQWYANYNTGGTKIPLYRVESNGKNSEIIHMLLDIDRDAFKFFDIRRKSANQFIDSRRDETLVRFYYKNKHGIETISTKLDIEVKGKKYRIKGLKEINERFLKFLKTEGYKYEEYSGRKGY